MLSNLKTRFERNLIYVRLGPGPSLGSDLKAAAPRPPGRSGKHGFLLLAPDLWPLI